MDMLSSAKAARQKMAKLKLCASLATYLDEIAPKEEVKVEKGKAMDLTGMAVIGKGHGDVAETDPWAGGGGKKKKKGKKKKAQGSSVLQHSMIRLNGFAEVREHNLTQRPPRAASISRQRRCLISSGAMLRLGSCR
jgi:hypothetical protein